MAFKILQCPTKNLKWLIFFYLTTFVDLQKFSKPVYGTLKSEHFLVLYEDVRSWLLWACLDPVWVPRRS